MRFRVVSLALGALALISVMGLWAQNPTKNSGTPKPTEVRDEAALQEQILSRQFKEFLEQVLKLKQRLERSPRLEDQEQAKNLQRVLDRAQDSGLSTRFDKIVHFLKTEKFTNLADITKAAEDSKRLADEMREIIDLMRMDSRANKSREEKKLLEDIVKDIEKAIRDQENTRALTELKKTERRELELIQKSNKDQTDKIAKSIDKLNGKDDKSNQGGEAKPTKGDPKDGGKDGGKKGEARDAGEAKEGKQGEAKDGGDPKQAKTGEAKTAEAKGGEPKESKPGSEAPPAEAKSGKPGSEAKNADAKGSKDAKGSPGEAKDSPKDSKGGEAKSGDAKDAGKGEPKDKTSEAKGAPKAGDENKKEPGEAKTAKPSDSKENKAGAKDSKPGADSKPSESKSGDAKSGDSKKGEAKAGPDSKGQSSAKSPPPSGGQPPPDSPQAQPKGSNEPPPPQQPKNSPDDQISKKQVQDANYKQDQAQKDIKDGKDDDASKKQGGAIDDLKDAKKKLEDRLKQLREEELERVLANLLLRCEKMLALQTEVYNGTEGVHKLVEASADKKPTRDNQATSAKLSNKEKEIVIEATKAMEVLEAEGTAVAFPAIFEQVREDMKHIDRRLDISDTGLVTQAIEKDVMATLKDMIDALKKAKQDLDDKKNPPPPKPGEPKAQQPQDQKLLDQIAELKMIRSMQIRLNDRTVIYGKMYQGEQAFEQNVRREISGLAERQDRIFEITNKIAKGDNK
jgi:hypothetical protein